MDSPTPAPSTSAVVCGAGEQAALSSGSLFSLCATNGCKPASQPACTLQLRLRLCLEPDAQRCLFAPCRGGNAKGQLGDGSTTNQLTPKKVNSAKTFTSVSAYKDHTCALTDDVEIWCWVSGRRWGGVARRREAEWGQAESDVKNELACFTFLSF